MSSACGARCMMCLKRRSVIESDDMFHIVSNPAANVAADNYHASREHNGTSFSVELPTMWRPISELTTKLIHDDRMSCRDLRCGRSSNVRIKDEVNNMVTASCQERTRVVMSCRWTCSMTIWMLRLLIELLIQCSSLTYKWEWDVKAI